MIQKGKHQRNASQGINVHKALSSATNRICVSQGHAPG
jgi:hypothetical protein